MNVVFEAQRNSTNAVYASMGYSGGLAAIIRALDRADSSAIVGSNIVTVVFGDEVGAIVLAEAADTLDIEGVLQEAIVATIAANEAADTVAGFAEVLSTIHAAVAVNDAADSADIGLFGNATTSATIIVTEISDGAGITVLLRPTAQLAISDLPDGADIRSLGQLWQVVPAVPTIWTPVDA